jgi:hypothetical protein
MANTAPVATQGDIHCELPYLERTLLDGLDISSLA